MRVLITGGAGFIGSHLVRFLLERGDQVRVADDFSTGASENLKAVSGESALEIIESDLTSESQVTELFDGVDIVYHLAAAVGVALIAERPRQTIERNIQPTQLVLAEATERQKSGRPVPVFIASTSEVYGKNPKALWSEEDDLVFGATTKPRWSYGCSKAIDEFLALACFKESNLPVVVGRFFNVVGPRQTGAYGMVLPRFVQAALRGDDLLVHDDGQQERCFAHVQDVIQAVVQLTEMPEAAGRVYNIGSNQPITILALAKRVIELAESESKVKFQSYESAYDSSFEDIRRRVPDLSRIEKTIGYKPTFGMDDIIRDVIASFRTKTS